MENMKLNLLPGAPTISGLEYKILKRINLPTTNLTKIYNLGYY